MKKEMLRGFSMLMLIVGLAFVTAVVSANGQTQIISDVPFDFVVGEKTMPAGQYTIREFTNDGRTLLVAGRNSKSSVIRLTNNLQPTRGKTQARLVFHRYGQNYFLAEAWKGGDSIGKQLRMSRQERAIEGQLAAVVSKSELAQGAYETIELVAVVR